MKSICVLGNGQLGRMLRQAGEPLGITVYPVGLAADPAAIPYHDSVITAEIERWPDTPLTHLLAHHPHFVNRTVFPLLADRQSQKQLLDQLRLPTAPWQALTSPEQWPDIFTALSAAVMVKRRTGGYDGRGQSAVTPETAASLPQAFYGESIVEQMIPFTGEVSLIGARSQEGHCVFYPLTHNLHQQGILRASVALPDPATKYQTDAEQMLSRIMQQLNYVGVMAMECFVLDNQLLINELAPRVHNSGHWTQNGASISQFELHLRALLDLPMPTPVASYPTVMINLIGVESNPTWLSLPLVHLHWYDKTVLPGRKVGHLNVNSESLSRLNHTLEQLKSLLPADYQTAIAWASTCLSGATINT